MIEELSSEGLSRMSISDLWNYVMARIDELDKKQKAELEKARKGVIFEIHIGYYTNEHYTINATNIAFMGASKVPIEDFWDDKDAREAILRKLVIEMNRGPPSLTEPR